MPSAHCEYKLWTGVCRVQSVKYKVLSLKHKVWSVTRINSYKSDVQCNMSSVECNVEFKSLERKVWSSECEV